MKIIFEYGQKRLILPVNPDHLEIITPSNAQKVNVVGIGQVSIPQGQDLRYGSINSFFWQYLFDNVLRQYTTDYFTEALSLATIRQTGDEGFMQDDSKKFRLLNEYVRWFDEWQASKEHARFTVVSMPNEPKYNIDMYITCENFQWQVKAGEESDYYYRLDFLEWKNISAVELNTTTDSQGNTTAEKSNGNNRTSVKERVQEVITKPIDTLWGIAKKYGEGGYDDWRVLYSIPQNATIIANNLANLSNQRLKMPMEWL